MHAGGTRYAGEGREARLVRLGHQHALEDAGHVPDVELVVEIGRLFVRSRKMVQGSKVDGNGALAAAARPPRVSMQGCRPVEGTAVGAASAVVGA